MSRFWVEKGKEQRVKMLHFCVSPNEMLGLFISNADFTWRRVQPEHEMGWEVIAQRSPVLAAPQPRVLVLAVQGFLISREEASFHLSNSLSKGGERE